VSFISWSFLVLYLAALALRWGLPGVSRQKQRRGLSPQVMALLLLSWVFYAWHVPWYILLILFCIVVNYFAALVIEAVPRTMQSRRKFVLSLSLLASLGLLAWYKYAGFLASTLNHAAELGLPAPEILLPIGISFYTFQSIGYTIDVYRGQVQAERRFLNMACFISFFPQLVAGPIVRAREMLYQFDRRRRFHAPVFIAGAYLILRGLFLKMVVADNLGIIVDQHWMQAGQPGGEALALAMLVFFACQLFCDFAGYVDIGRGAAYQLGYRLPINFNAPYIATSFSAFWQRWNITLSQWMRDYLYIPLGGNRKGRFRVYFNLVLVMLISGLWHGANWTFVAWGGMLGLALVIEHMLGLGKTSRGWGISLGWFVIVQATWILSMALFRSPSIEEGGAVMFNAVQGLATLPGLVLQDTAQGRLIALGCWFTVPVWLLHLRSFLAERTRLGPASGWERSVYAGAMLAAVLVLYSSSRQFIYFQF